MKFHKRPMNWELVVSDWFLSRPQRIRDWMWKFPPGSAISDTQSIRFVVGVGEGKDPDGDTLILSYTDPCIDYEGATADTHHVHFNCLAELLTAHKNTSETCSEDITARSVEDVQTNLRP